MRVRLALGCKIVFPIAEPTYRTGLGLGNGWRLVRLLGASVDMMAQVICAALLAIAIAACFDRWASGFAIPGVPVRPDPGLRWALSVD